MATRMELRKSASRPSRQGLSLLEVILSLTILAVAVAILSQTMFLASENGIRSREIMAAQNLCETALNDVLTGLTPAQSTSWTSVTASNSNMDWYYMIETLAAEQPDMIGIQVTVTNDPERTTNSPIDAKLVRWIIDPSLGLDSPASQSTTGQGAGAGGAGASGASSGTGGT